MRLIDRLINCSSRDNETTLYPLYDIHVGARTTAETLLRKHIKTIAADPNALVILGGDILDAIKPQDGKRFDMDTFPDWLLEGDATTTRERLNDILSQQLNRTVNILQPIEGKIIGAICGNHEFTVQKYYNENVQAALCRRLQCEDLTDESLIRLRFKCSSKMVTVIIYARHGWGSSRTESAEAMKLRAMRSEWEVADVSLTGHTHLALVLPPKPILEIPRSGKLPDETIVRHRWAANPGCWLFSHSVGASSYVSRSCYEARPMMTCKIVIHPYGYRICKGGNDITRPHIEIRSITL